MWVQGHPDRACLERWAGGVPLDGRASQPVRLLPPPENRLPATLAADVAEILVRLAAQLDSVGAEVATIRQQLDRQERAVHPAAPAATP